MLQCESEGSSFISVAKVDRRFEPKQKRDRKRECEFDCNDSESSSDGSCLVANESIRLSDNSPAQRRINKPTSFLNSYKRRIVDRGTCSLKGRASCVEKVTLHSSPTALFSNNSPVQDEIAVSSRPHRSSQPALPDDSSFEKENYGSITEISPDRKFVPNQSKVGSVLRLVQMNSQPPIAEI